MKIKHMAIAGLVALAATACGGSTTSAVSGNRDDIKHITAIVKTVEVKTYGKTCTKRVNGVCKKKRTIVTGKKKVKKVVRRESWCVELDNVDGDKNHDDVWFTTSYRSYVKASGLAEGEEISFVPVDFGC